MSQPQRSVCGRVGSATCLPFGSRGKGEVLFPSPILCHLWQVGLLILDPESRTGHVPATALRRADPASLPGQQGRASPDCEGFAGELAMQAS